ncbi:hypothetical protein LJC14_04270 [Treponema sp. OttesenSCG-928-L16]|nr:hypothetical protein [Treponema sp. OttesenSCG-928-L16]
MNSGTISKNKRFGVENWGRFTMNDGTISENDGHGVYSNYNARSTMYKGSISGNGGGVNIGGGIFTMYDGSIDNNAGRGVNVGGTFNMHGGIITKNTESGSGATGAGGGAGVRVGGGEALHHDCGNHQL